MTNEKDKHIVKRHGRNAQTSKSLKIFSTNAAGLVSGKLNSLKSEVVATAANIGTIKENHSLRKGLIKMPVGFVTFEAIRKATHGGTMCTPRSKPKIDRGT